MDSNTPNAPPRAKKVAMAQDSSMSAKDSVQKRNRKSGLKKTRQMTDGSEIDATKQGPAILPTYDCGGAIHIKFSLKREAINVVYKHNPIHTTRPVADRHVASKPSLGSLSRWYSTPTDMICSPPILAADNHLASLAAPADGKQPRKR